MKKIFFSIVVLIAIAFSISASAMLTKENQSRALILEIVSRNLE